MSDTDRSDPHPDSPPSEEPDRGSIESVEEPASPLDGPGVEDGVGGTGGVNKAQDKPTS